MNVKDIPINSKVRKVTGTYVYTLIKGLPKIFDDHKLIKVDVDNVYFLFSKEKVEYNSISDELNLVWIVDEEELLDYLVDRNDERESKWN